MSSLMPEFNSQFTESFGCLPEKISKVLNICFVCAIVSMLLLSNLMFRSHPLDFRIENAESKFPLVDSSHSCSDYIYLSIKTTYQFHRTRLLPSVKTWIPDALALNESGKKWIIPKIAIITDVGDEAFMESHLSSFSNRVSLIPTPCKSSHHGTALSCKMSREFQAFYNYSKSNRMPRWFCHFDDDAYVNPEFLYASLQEIESGKSLENPQYYYVGKRSLKYGFNHTDVFNHSREINIQFANGDAYCLNDALMLRMKSSVMNSSDPLNLVNLSHKNGDLGDDVLLGYILTGYMNATYIELSNIYSHTYTNLPTTKWSDACEAVAVCQSKTNHLQPNFEVGYNAGASWKHLDHKHRVSLLHNLCRRYFKAKKQKGPKHALYRMDRLTQAN